MIGSLDSQSELAQRVNELAFGPVRVAVVRKPNGQACSAAQHLTIARSVEAAVLFAAQELAKGREVKLVAL